MLMPFSNIKITSTEIKASKNTMILRIKKHTEIISSPILSQELKKKKESDTLYCPN